VAALGEATETPERLWTAAMRANTAEEVAHLALQAHAAQVSPHTRKEKKRKDYAFWCQFNEKPSIILGCQTITLASAPASWMCLKWLQSCCAWLHKLPGLHCCQICCSSSLFHPESARSLAVPMCCELMVTLTFPFCQFL